MPTPVGFVIADNGVKVLIVDTRTRSGLLTLNTISSAPNRSITIKDAYGTFDVNPLTITTSAPDLFEGSNGSTLILTTPFTCTTIYASENDSTWYIFSETQSLNTLFTTNLIPALPGLDIGDPRSYPIANIYIDSNVYMNGLAIISDGANMNIGGVITGDGGGLSNLPVTVGLSSLSSVVSYGLSSVSASFTGLSSLSSVVSYGFSSLSTSYARSFVTSSLTTSSLTFVGGATMHATSNMLYYGNNVIYGGALQWTPQYITY